MSKAVRILLLFAVPLPVFAGGRTECGTVKSQFMPAPVAYCALLPASYDAQPKRKFPTLYFLHGLGGDHTFLVSLGGWSVIADAQEQKRLGEFVVITPNGGTSFYINSKNGRAPYEDFFVRDFVPQMEKRFRLLPTRSGREISGISMGGYGALRLAFKHPQMFTAASALMPALLEQLPHGAGNAGLTSFLGTAFGRPADEAFWKANSPFVFARTADLHGLQIYIACGDQDDYGFDAGTREMDKLLTARHVPHTVHIYPGRHDLAFVAQHLEESLTFDSHAFGFK
ncbi:MAG TPA: alpha/beta hydrolase family protein [Verrucomicrobiae bacterium]|jgi:S-formylglutathione hydrolase FrmB|nr:alpha/beta hydrolase family protein [Verrucomicrobiae bacterium]